MLNTPRISIYSNKVWIKNRLIDATITISDGRISEIQEGVKLKEAQDFSDSIIMPGVIDAHVHINEPGRTDWEGFDTATKAAAQGGITTIVDMPLNSSPVVTNVDAFRKKLLVSRGKLHVNCGFWAGATSDRIEEVRALLDEGCLGVKVFLSDSGLKEFPNISIDHLDALMQALSNQNKPILAHCELDTLPANSNLSSCSTSYQEYLKSRPKSWENQAIEKFVSISEKYNCRAHIVHLASDESVYLIIQKKKEGVPITVETCPHYLIFSAEKIADGDTLFKCAPPIRSASNGQGLKQALKNRVIDFITSDHSPAPPELKQLKSGDFTKAWGGIAGLQYLLSASWTVLRDVMTLEEFIPLLTSQPSKFLSLSNSKGHIKVGHDADLCVWRPHRTMVVDERDVQHKHKISPYVGMELYGTIDATMVNGYFVYQNGKFDRLSSGSHILGS